MKKNILLIVASIAFFASCNRQRSFDEEAQLDARRQTQKVCPREVADGVRLDSITYSIPTRTMSYHYTMHDQFDNPQAIQAGEQKFRQAVLRQIIQSIEMKKAKEHGVTFRYIYRSQSTGQLLLKETFTKDEYTVKQ